MKDLEKLIGYKFNNINLLERAITHSSYANEKNILTGDNERLEFLGDSVLGFITAEYLFTAHRDLPEGDLTKLRSYAVCEKSLFEYAKEIGLGEKLLLGKGEEHTGGRERPSVLSDAFEAIIAAIFLDGGIDEARKFVLKFVIPYVNAKPCFKDYKTTLQEVVQQNQGEILEYILISERGPDHDKCFEVEVHLNSNVIGAGEGRSKKQAEQAAAREALELMGI
ncbi:MAG: ribonuclease III [Oscillospiraceae bacterium]